MLHLRRAPCAIISSAFTLLLVGCIPLPPTTWSPTPPGSSAPEFAGAAPGLSCVAVVQCLAACADADCIAACVDASDPGSRGDVDALLACNAEGRDCEAELVACRADGGAAIAATAGGNTSADQPGQPVSNADILPWLVGEWIGSRHQFVFYPDGRVRRSQGGGMVEDRPGTSDDRHCVAVSNDVGTVRQEGDLLIMDFAGTDSNTCGIKEAQGPTVVRYRITWFDNAYDESPYLQLILVDIDCTNGAMWCNDGMNRR